MLAGDGTGQNLLGLIPQATAFNNALRKAGDTKIDTLRRAILQVRIAEYRASAIALNPIDWADLELTKDSTGQYIWVNVQDGGQQRMWRLPVIDTNAVPEGEFLVGAFNIAAQVFDREDANVEVSTEDGDNFTKNMVTIRAEERLAMAVSADDRLRFPMTEDWQPNAEDLAAQTRLMGIPVEAITPEVVGCFKAHYLALPDTAHTSKRWANELAKWIKRERAFAAGSDEPEPWGAKGVKV
ncbi:phage major capsid protein [Pseudomonas sp. NY15436]|uniref:phage major capsid protein n=1 Tax=Pseudomonas sp. NY15436 TaxID=3400359 RepID=UPI003A8407BE